MDGETEIIKKDAILKGHTGDYRIIKPLGLAGATAQVFLTVREQDGKRFAFKLMHPDLSPEMQKHFKYEMVVLMKLRPYEDEMSNHHIPQIIESSDLLEEETQLLFEALNKRPFILMDFADGVSVETLLREKRIFPESEAVENARQFAEVLFVIHRAKLTYTDMKLNNLIWNPETRQLMVIDWNVVAEKRLERDAPKDRLRAATYLYQMTTGLSIDLKEDPQTGLQVANQDYRRKNAYKKLSVGTRKFLLKAFHLDLFSRHGKGGSQQLCTSEFYEELKTHADRFKMPLNDLIGRGEIAFKDKRWLEAYVDLDVAERRFILSEDEAIMEQYKHLQDILKTSKEEAEKLGRGAFRSGRGRYVNALYLEALEDLELALKDDPFDLEARMYAILTKLAISIKGHVYEKFKDPLEHCISAIMEGQLGLAKSALKPIPEAILNTPEIRSLLTEIEVREAVFKGHQLLITNELDEAEKSFQSAYQKRDQILYIDILEENLGSLHKLYELVEDLKSIYLIANEYLEKGEFRNAAREFLNAKLISQGSKFADEKYKEASTYEKIQNFLKTHDIERILKECHRASSLYPENPILQSLKNKVGDRLHELAAEASANKNFLEEQKYLRKLLELLPNDSAAKARLKEIQKELSERYKEELENFERYLNNNPSIENCKEVIQKISEKQHGLLEEKRKQFLKYVNKLHKDISSLSSKLDKYEAKEKFSKQLDLLAKAETNRWVLPQGNPSELRIRLQENHLQMKIQEIEKQLKSGKAQEARNLCQKVIKSQIEEKHHHSLQMLLEKANKLIEIQKQYKDVQKKFAEIKEENDNNNLESLKLHWNMLFYQREMIETQSTGNETDVKYQYKRKVEDLRVKTHELINNLYSQGIEFLANEEIISARKIQHQLNEIITAFINFNEEFKEEIKKYQGWYRQFVRSIEWLEVDLPGLHHKQPSLILQSFANLVEDDGLKQSILEFQSATEKSIDSIKEKLSVILLNTKNLPALAWLHRYLEREVVKNEFWQNLNSNVSDAVRLFYKSPTYFRGDQECSCALDAVGRIDSFIQNQDLQRDSISLSWDQLKKAFTEAEVLLNEAQKYGRLKESNYITTLKNHIENLHQKIKKKETELKAELVKQIDGLLKELKGTEYDHEIRIELEAKIKGNIAELRYFDQLKAEEYEARLSTILKALPREVLKKIAEYENYKRLTEFQRRKVDVKIFNDSSEYLKSFEDQFQVYEKLESNMQFELKSTLKEPTSDTFQKLLQLREKYGDFPELSKAINEQRKELFKKNYEKRFIEIRESWEDVTLKADPGNVKDSLEQIQPELLTDSMQIEYLKVKDEVEKILILRDEISEDDFEDYLINNVENRAMKWLNALEWALKEKSNGRLGLFVNSNTQSNLENFMFRHFSNKRSQVKNIILFRWINDLITKVGTMNPAYYKHIHEAQS